MLPDSDILKKWKFKPGMDGGGIGMMVRVHGGDFESGSCTGGSLGASGVTGGWLLAGLAVKECLQYNEP